MQHIKAKTKLAKTCPVHHYDRNYLPCRSNFACVMRTVKSCIVNILLCFGYILVDKLVANFSRTCPEHVFVKKIRAPPIKNGYII